MLSACSVRRDIIMSRHDVKNVGHPGQAKTLELIGWTYYWPSMKQLVHQYVEGCDICRWVKNIPQNTKGLLKPLEIPEGPWQDITYNFIPELPKSEGFDAVLAVVDHFTKMAHFIPTTTKADATEVVKLLTKEVFSKHGTPLRTISDRGNIFNSKVLKA